MGVSRIGHLRMVFFLISFLLLSACNSTTTPSAEPKASDIKDGVAETGQGIYETHCSVCHSLDPAIVKAGPNLLNLVSRSAVTIQLADYDGKATSAQGYIRESIVNPTAYYVPDYPKNVMPNYETTLSSDKLNDVMAYLMTLN